MNRIALIIFQKNEQLGKVKTRLAATVGNEKALEIYKILIAHTYKVIQLLPVDTYIYYSDFVPKVGSNIPKGFNYCVQSGNDLGDRMKNAFESLFVQSYDQIIILGTDCAELTSSHIEDAIKKLEKVDVVIGPAEDGGYYLLGLKKKKSELFEDIEWSTSKVFTQTVSKLIQANLSYDTIEKLSDIDREEDWDKVKLKFVEVL